MPDEIALSKEELEDLVEKKVEERIRGSSDEDREGSGSVSRRNFLKGALGGAAGVGLAGFLPSATGLDILPQDSLSVYNSSDSESFRFDGNGTLEAEGIGNASSPVSVTADEVTMETQFIGGTKHLSTGEDLGFLIQNAVENGYSSVRVHPRQDGSNWEWSTDVVHDTGEDGRLEIIVDDTAIVDYTGSNRPLTVKGTSGPRDNAFRIVGGVWKASGDPSEWLLIDDQIGPEISPRRVDYRNTGATALVLRNDTLWTELAIIEGTYRAGNGIEFVPASENPDSSGGTDSFQGTTIKDVRINHEQEGGFGIRLSGIFMYNTILRPNIFPQGDNSSGMIWNTKSGGTGALGTTIVSMQVEAAGFTSGTTALTSGPDYDGYYGPLFINPRAGGDTESRTDGSRFPYIGYGGNGLQMGNWGGDKMSFNVGNGGLDVDGNGSFSGNISVSNSLSFGEFNSKIDADNHFNINSNSTTVFDASDGSINWELYSVQDVRDISSPSRGQTAYHDGSGSNTEGPAFYNGSGWKSLVDGSNIS